MSQPVEKPRAVTSKRLSLIDLNRKARQVSKQIQQVLTDRKTLSTLYKEFSKLAFDRLTLDLLISPHGDNTKRELEALRVIICKIRAATQLYNVSNVPLSLDSNDNSNCKARTSLVRGLKVYLTRKSAETKLVSLKQEYNELCVLNCGLSEMISQFREDNATLRKEIQLIKGSASNRNTSFDSGNISTKGSFRVLTIEPKQRSALGMRRVYRTVPRLNLSKSIKCCPSDSAIISIDYRRLSLALDAQKSRSIACSGLGTVSGSGGIAKPKKH